MTQVCDGRKKLISLIAVVCVCVCKLQHNVYNCSISEVVGPLVLFLSYYKES